MTEQGGNPVIALLTTLGYTRSFSYSFFIYILIFQITFFHRIKNLTCVCIWYLVTCGSMNNKEVAIKALLPQLTCAVPPWTRVVQRIPTPEYPPLNTEYWPPRLQRRWMDVRVTTVTLTALWWKLYQIQKSTIKKHKYVNRQGMVICYICSCTVQR